MDILTDLLNRVLTVQAGLESGSPRGGGLIPPGNDILEQQRIQLLEGKDSGGEDIRPYYSEDLKPAGHFHSVESAGRYAAWKQDLTYPYTVQRNPDAPNLYITGKFHEEIGVEFGVDAVAIVGETAYAKAIMAKYGNDTFGLNADKWAEIWESGSYDSLLGMIKAIIYAY